MRPPCGANRAGRRAGARATRINRKGAHATHGGARDARGDRAGARNAPRPHAQGRCSWASCTWQRGEAGGGRPGQRAEGVEHWGLTHTETRRGMWETT